MSRDYKSHKSSTARRSGGSLMLGLFIGYVLGLVSAMGVWMYISQAPSPFLTEEKPVDSQLTIPDGSNVKNESQTNATSETELSKVDEKNRFDFYTILPGVEEPVTEQEIEQVIKQQATPTASDPVEHFFLQVGSFRSTDEAENLKARLALLGIVSSVQSANIPEKGVWHRVRIGPFNKMGDIDQIRTSLQQNGIDANFIKVNAQ